MIKRLGMTGEEPIWVRWDFTPELERFRVTGILGVHADEYETAAMVRYFPETVDYDGADATCRRRNSRWMTCRSGAKAARRRGG